ncbi:MAG TPA: CopG family transcriptional regulator [Patescibacteria group bacterium]|nr:CopG family transcriptional regulator [Patescibacteria group bacterium]
MSNTTSYTNAPADIEESLNQATVMSDFLPSPKELISKVEKEKVTIAINKRSLDLFKEYAKKHNTKYQPMIDGVLGAYADKFLRR